MVLKANNQSQRRKVLEGEEFVMLESGISLLLNTT